VIIKRALFENLYLKSTSKSREMAEVLDEFDEATPVKSSYCKQLTTEEYEEEGCLCTEDALSELMSYLDSDPAVYAKVLQRRKKEDAESSSVFSFLKVQLLSYWHGRDAGFESVTDAECKKELAKMKENMSKAFEYSLGMHKISKLFSFMKFFIINRGKG